MGVGGGSMATFILTGFGYGYSQFGTTYGRVPIIFGRLNLVWKLGLKTGTKRGMKTVRGQKGLKTRSQKYTRNRV